MPSLLNSLTLDGLKARWNGWTSGSNNRRIFRAIFIVGVSTVGVKAIALGKELMVASTFGTGDALEAFLIAFMVPIFVINFVVQPMKTALMPTYIKVKKQEGREAAESLISGVLYICLLILIGVTVLLYITAPYLIPVLASGFSPEKIDLTLSLYYALIPIVLINGMIYIFSSLLDSEEKFAVSALAPVAVPSMTLLALFFLSPVWGIYAMVLGNVTGFIIQAAILFRVLKKHDIKLRLAWTGMTDSLRQKFGQYGYLVSSSFLTFGKGLVNQAMAATLVAGSIASLGYGNRVVELILGVGVTSLGTAVLPYFSKMVAEDDWAGISHTLKKYSLYILGISIPLTYLIFVWSETFIGFIFQRGQFSQEDSILVGQILSFYSLQIPFKALNILGLNLLAASRQNKVLLIIAAISLTGNILLNFYFMKTMDVKGIALATSCADALTTLLVYFWLYTITFKAKVQSKGSS